MAYLTTRRTLASLLRRALSSSSSPSSPLTSRSRFALSILNQQPRSQLVPNSLTVPTRFKTSAPDCGKRPSKEALLLDGCDFEHWLIVMDFPTDPKPSEEQMVDSFVKTLASVLGSEEEARKKIYSVCTSSYTGFGALISEELSSKIKGLPGVLWVLPDSYLDVRNKDYGGDLYVDGKVTHRPLFTPVEIPTRIRKHPSRSKKKKGENLSAGTEK